MRTATFVDKKVNITKSATGKPKLGIYARAFYLYLETGEFQNNDWLYLSDEKTPLVVIEAPAIQIENKVWQYTVKIVTNSPNHFVSSLLVKKGSFVIYKELVIS